MDGVVSISFSVGIEHDVRTLEGLLGDVRVNDSPSDEAPVVFDNNLWNFFCLRASFLFNPTLRLIAALMCSAVGISSGSATTGVKAIGLATCARVAAFVILK